MCINNTDNEFMRQVFNKVFYRLNRVNDTIIMRAELKFRTVGVPVEGEFFELVEITCDVLERSVGDARTPRQVQTSQLPQVLGDQFHAVVCDLTATGEAQHREVRQRVD